MAAKKSTGSSQDRNPKQKPLEQPSSVPPDPIERELEPIAEFTLLQRITSADGDETGFGAMRTVGQRMIQRIEAVNLIAPLFARLKHSYGVHRQLPKAREANQEKAASRHDKIRSKVEEVLREHPKLAKNHKVLISRVQASFENQYGYGESTIRRIVSDVLQDRIS